MSILPKHMVLLTNIISMQSADPGACISLSHNASVQARYLGKKAHSFFLARYACLYDADQILPDPILSLYRYGCMLCYSCIVIQLVHSSTTHLSKLPKHMVLLTNTSCMQSADPGSCISLSHNASVQARYLGKKDHSFFSSKISQICGLRSTLNHHKIGHLCSRSYQLGMYVCIAGAHSH